MNNIEARAIAEAERLAGSDAEALYARLGRQEKAIERRPELAQDPTLDPPYDSSHMGLIDDLMEVGRRVASKWSRKLHELVCGEDGGEERKNLLAALNVSQAAAIALVTSMLLPLVSPAIAAPLAVIIVREFLAPAGKTICEFWDEKLDEAL
jgi:hypothetical protein